MRLIRSPNLWFGALVLTALACRSDREERVEPFGLSDLAEAEAWAGCADHPEQMKCGGEACLGFFERTALSAENADDLVSACTRGNDPVVITTGAPELLECITQACQELSRLLPDLALDLVSDGAHRAVSAALMSNWLDSEERMLALLDRMAAQLERGTESGQRRFVRVIAAVSSSLELSEHAWETSPSPHAWPRASKRLRTLAAEYPDQRAWLLELAAYFDWTSTAPTYLDSLLDWGEGSAQRHPTAIRILEGIHQHEVSDELHQRFMDELCRPRDLEIKTHSRVGSVCQAAWERASAADPAD